jgi:hypothetical protein
MKNSQYPSARKSGLVIQEMPDEVLVYDLESNKAHCLNETAAFVWKSCDGKTSVSEIAALVDSKSGAKVSEDLVWLAIDQLSENNLLEEELRADFAGQSRREVIKKIGLATVVAIPVIASLVAPRSALASTSCTCGSTPDCTLQGPPCGTTCNTTAGICA